MRLTGHRALSVLVALLALTTVELIRSSGPLLDMAFSEGVLAAAGSALVTYALPGLFVLALAWSRRVDGPVLIGSLVLAGARVVVQLLEGGARFGAGLATVALGIAVLTLAVRGLAGRAGGQAAVGAVAAGLAASVGMQLALGTWDAYWRHDLVGWAVTLVLVAGLVLAALLARHQAAPLRDVRRLWVLGPVLGLSVMTVANPAFAASQTGVPLAVAGPVIGAAWLLAASITLWPAAAPPRWARWGAWVDALVLAVLVAAAMASSDAATLVMLAALPLALVSVAARALVPLAGPPRTGRTAGAASLVGLGVILPLLVYQLDYDIPLGFPNWLVLVATAAVIGLAGARRRGGGPAQAGADPEADAVHETGTAPTADVDREGAERTPAVGPWPAQLLAGAAALVLLGTVVAAVQAAGSARPPAEAPPDLTLVSWNLHYGVDPAGNVDLEQVARTIAEHDPDVVALQEVSRGWVMGGGVDMATWLANRLGMHMSFAPAADGQFGNAILTTQAHDDVTVLDLPFGDGPQRRSAISADVQVAGGPIRVTSVHLQHRESNTVTRLDQLAALLADSRSPGVLAGDFNAEPGWSEIELITKAYTSAQDAAGDPAALTSPSIDPQYRIDWVFGREVTFSSAEVLGDALSSDHLPLVVTVRP